MRNTTAFHCVGGQAQAMSRPLITNLRDLDGYADILAVSSLRAG